MTLWEFVQGYALALRFLLLMAGIAACGYACAVGAFDLGVALYGDSAAARTVIGPASVLAGIAGMVVIPGLIAALFKR